MTFVQKSSYTYDEIISCGEGTMFGEGNAKLPLPPMLMFDRITNVSEEGGAYGKGVIEAELDINPDLWFFECHFKNDPVMPGCLGLDAVWQLLGFYLGWKGELGSGRALGLGELKLSEQIVPTTKKVKYVVDIKRVISGKLVMGIGDGTVYADDKVACKVSGMKVGLFDNSAA
tara:strand:- start:71 stop:589 length:519 start_codon:yes stop_codon:yes gene_type:complete